MTSAESSEAVIEWLTATRSRRRVGALHGVGVRRARSAWPPPPARRTTSTSARFSSVASASWRERTVSTPSRSSPERIGTDSMRLDAGLARPVGGQRARVLGRRRRRRSASSVSATRPAMPSPKATVRGMRTSGAPGSTLEADRCSTRALRVGRPQLHRRARRAAARWPARCGAARRPPRATRSRAAPPRPARAAARRGAWRRRRGARCRWRAPPARPAAAARRSSSSSNARSRPVVDDERAVHAALRARAAPPPPP